MALDLGLDWESFGETPHEIVDQISASDMVLLGTALILMGEFMSLEDTRDRFGAPAWVLDELDVAIGDTMGERWYNYLAGRVRATRLDPSNDASFSYGDGDLVVRDGPDIEQIAYTSRWDPINTAGTLIHEAGHLTQDPHVACPNAMERGCDSNGEDGVDGSQVLFHRTWMSRLAMGATDSDTLCFGSEVKDYCGMILDISGFEACIFAETSVGGCYP